MVVRAVAHDPLGNLEFGQLALHCALATPDGFELAIACCVAEQDANTEELPVVLGHDLNA